MVTIPHLALLNSGICCSSSLLHERQAAQQSQSSIQICQSYKWYTRWPQTHTSKSELSLQWALVQLSTIFYPLPVYLENKSNCIDFFPVIQQINLVVFYLQLPASMNPAFHYVLLTSVSPSSLYWQSGEMTMTWSILLIQDAGKSAWNI